MKFTGMAVCLFLSLCAAQLDWTCLGASSCYAVSSATMSQTSAVSFCDGYGAGLASVTSAEENEYISATCPGECWLGIVWDYDDAAERLWQDGTPVTYTNFSPGEPNGNGANSGYVMMYSGGTWDDRWYTSTNYAICKAAQTTPPSSTPTNQPTLDPTEAPSELPTAAPTVAPTGMPTTYPTTAPTVAPTAPPTTNPTVSPSSPPSEDPTESPSPSPTDAPTVQPSMAPTPRPTFTPTAKSIAATLFSRNTFIISYYVLWVVAVLAIAIAICTCCRLRKMFRLQRIGELNLEEPTHNVRLSTIQLSKYPTGDSLTGKPETQQHLQISIANSDEWTRLQGNTPMETPEGGMTTK